MKKLIIICALCTASAGFAQAPAQAPASTPEQSSTSASPDPNETICRNIEASGTRLGRARSCKTRAQWEAADRQGRANAERAQARSQD